MSGHGVDDKRVTFNDVSAGLRFDWGPEVSSAHGGVTSPGVNSEMRWVLYTAPLPPPVRGNTLQAGQHQVMQARYAGRRLNGWLCWCLFDHRTITVASLDEALLLLTEDVRLCYARYLVERSA